MEDLVNEGMKEAKDNLAKAITIQIRNLPQESQAVGESETESVAALRNRIWKHLENGELDAAQHANLMKVLEESLSDRSNKPPAGGSAKKGSVRKRPKRSRVARSRGDVGPSDDKAEGSSTKHN